VAAGPTAPRRLSAGVRRLGASTARFPFRVKLHLTPADRMVLRAAVETVLADPDPPPAGLADAPALLSALRPSLGDEPPNDTELPLAPRQLVALRYALAYQLRIRGYVVGRPGAINAAVDLHDKLERLAGGSSPGALGRLARRLTGR